ncbi:LPXTG cell wall anchor domain-containing protein [Oscillibacter sp.]|uniref:LPXTG cell wall anchor domain-containing protein n=1 Tax=Oscillibacter sp. TaxID=1945593 RepID=UPI0028B23F38|nr:LPXTG cell wall anchor domain-containing protein [Oscillibacter sp.]
MKQILALILTAFLVCTALAPPVLAAEEPIVPAETTDTVNDSGSGSVSDDSIDTATPSDADMVTDGDETSGTGDSTVGAGGTEDSAVPDTFDYTGSIISYTTPNAFTNTFNTDCGDTDFTQLQNELDSISISATAQKEGSSYPLTLSVTWDFSTVDAETPGTYTLIGNISIPQGATLLEGVENTVSLSVQVTSPLLTITPAAITLASFDEPYRTDAVAFPVGTTQEQLSQWFSQVTMGFTAYDADGNPYDLNSGSWSLDAINTVTAGVYYAFTSPDLGTEYTLADGVPLPQQLCAVSIQVPGEPDINCCVAGRGFLHFPWVLSATQEEQLEDFAVWLRQDGGEWTSLSDGFLFVSDGLQLSQQVLTYGSTYELKVTYPGGQTGVLTFQYDGELSILDYSGGDRDGGDVNGGSSGTGTQPAPIPNQPPDNSNEDNNSGDVNDSPDTSDSSSDADDTPQDSGSSSGEQQKPQEGQDSSLGGNEPAPTELESPSDSQSNDSHNNDGNSQAQIPVTEKPTAVTPATEAESAVPVFSDAFFTREAESTSAEQKNDTVPKPNDSAQLVMNPVTDDNNTQLEESSASQESVAVTESYSPTQTVISGLRLKNLCKEEESVVFGSGNVTVSIPSKLLLALDLSDTDTLTVRLPQPESNQIVLAVEVSGKPVTQLSGTVLRLRFMPKSENTDITIQNEAGGKITDVSYDGELLRFAVNATGTYTITELLSTQETGKSTSPLLPVSGGLLLTAGGITFFRRKRHG